MKNIFNASQKASEIQLKYWISCSSKQGWLFFLIITLTSIHTHKNIKKQIFETIHSSLQLSLFFFIQLFTFSFLLLRLREESEREKRGERNCVVKIENNRII